MLAVPLAVHLASQQPNHRIWYLASVICTGGIFASLSWSGVIGLAAAMVWYLTWCSQRTRIILAGLILASLLCLIILPKVSSLSISPTISRVFLGRVSIAYEGLQLASARPYLGWGYRAGHLSSIMQSQRVIPGVYYNHDVTLPHVHNLFVQTLLETGIIGFMALCFFLIHLFSAQATAWKRATQAAMLGYLVVQCFDLSWIGSSNLLSFVLVATNFLDLEKVPLRQRA